MEHLTPVSMYQVDITDGFWAEKQRLIHQVTSHAVLDRYEETGRFEAFRFNWKEGSDIPKPHFFWDSDVAKWLEGAAYILSKANDPVLEAKLEETISLIEKNRCEDGYFNIFHTVVEPENRFRIRDHHELYCLGHLIEAAAAYYESKGNDRFIRILEPYIDYVIRVFTVEKSAGFVTPGHEEIELALIRLYRCTGERKYLDLALFFLNQRGVADESDSNLSWCEINYNQTHLPVRQQYTAQGHAVRACYLYTGMAAAAGAAEDEALFSACEKLFEDITKKKMYITGGIGSSNHGEAFTIGYDLPNDTAYNETCASIALSFFADKMKDLDPDAKYADIVEREWYNGALSGLSLDGECFFYENPLEINLSDHTRHTSVKEGDRLPITQRPKGFNCSCCPPNIIRYFASVGGSIFSTQDKKIYIHQFVSANAIVSGSIITMNTEYPSDGSVQISAIGALGKTLYVRIPGWCKNYTFSHPYTVEKGYAVFVIDSANYELKANYFMKPVFYRANAGVRADAGKAAMMLGPVVYCMEKVDNDFNLSAVVIQTESEKTIRFDSLFNANTVTVKGLLYKEEEQLYTDIHMPAIRKEVTVKLIPYACFANRGESDMAVWFRYE